MTYDEAGQPVTGYVDQAECVNTSPHYPQVFTVQKEVYKVIIIFFETA